MSLRLKLVLAFFLLAVVPLAGITIYSYVSSLRAVRRAAEDESALLAQDMGTRMETVNNSLSRGLQRLRRFPFRRFMPGAGPGDDPHRSMLMGQLREQLGESANLVRMLEYVPGMQPPKGPGLPPPDQPEMERLVIPMADGQPPRVLVSVGEGAAAQARWAAGPPEHPAPPGFGPVAAGPPPDESSEGGARAAAMAHKTAELEARIHETTRKAVDAARKEMATTFGREFAAEVQGEAEGEAAGKVKAEIDSRQVLLQVLTRTRRNQGEIPFAVDAQGKVHTADPADLVRIERLAVVQAAVEKSPAPQPGLDRNWVVVVKKDPASEMTFGIARPLADRLGEIRRTAWRNLVYGLGLVGLALVGILPLSHRMTRSLRVLAQEAGQLARGNLEARVPVSSRDEIGQLALAFNQMAADLSRNQKRLVEQERLQKELEMCRRIQEELLPRGALRAGVVEVKGVTMPAREVGGDFFNYFPLSEGRIALLVGDVSGKGLPAALLMANLQATIQARLPLEPDLAKLAYHLDSEISASTPPEAYLTLFIAVLDTRSSLLSYVNAGHNPQFVLRADGTSERLESTGRPLGLLPGGGFVQKQILLNEGDAILFYTDGLVEAENPAGAEFGVERLETLVRSAHSDGLEGVLAGLESSVRAYRADVEASDDATMVLLRIGPLREDRGISGAITAAAE